MKRFHNMLRHLGLFRIQLVGSWKNFAEAVVEMSKSADFTMLSIKLDTLRQSSGYLVRAMDKVGFKKAGSADIRSYDDLERSLAYEGPNMAGFLTGLEEKLVVADDEWYSTILGHGSPSEPSNDDGILLDDAEVEDDEADGGDGEADDDDDGTPEF